MNFRVKRQKFFPPRTGSYIRWSRNAFFIIGILALGYVGFALIDTSIYQADETRRFEQALKDSRPSVGSSKDLHPSAIPPAPAEPDRESDKSPAIARREGAPLGRIEISRIGLAAIILDGIDESTLRRAVGHIPGTSLPGEKGNVALAGHRDSFFRALRNIRKDDEITLTTLAGSHRYQVHATKIVAPDDTEALEGSYDDILTLVTCYPFNFVGSAPKRFIVRAHRIIE